jgi:hypothetical protein
MDFQERIESEALEKYKKRFTINNLPIPKNLFSMADLGSQVVKVYESGKKIVAQYKFEIIDEKQQQFSLTELKRNEWIE